MPVWGVVNQKGGVGKTTTAVNLAAGLALRGQNTLLVDCDPQGNASTGIGIEKRKAKQTLYELFLNDEVPPCPIPIRANLDVIPSSIDLAGIDSAMHDTVGKEMILRETLEPLLPQYDWIILDAPPSLGLLTVNVLAASEKLLVPMQCEFYALEGLTQLLKTVELVKRRINPTLEIGCVLLTMYDARSRLTLQVAEELKGYFGEKVAKTVIPRNIKLSEAPSFGEPAVVRFPGSKGAVAYMKFVEEMIAS